MPTIKPEVFERDPSESQEATPNDERALLERLIVEGNLDEDRVFLAQMVRDVLEELRARHSDTDDPLVLTPAAMERYVKLVGDSYSVDTIRIQAIQVSNEETSDMTVAESTPLAPESILGKQIVKYAQMGLDNLDVSDWEALDDLVVTRDPALLVEIEELCLMLHASDLGAYGTARLKTVADTIGLKLPKVETEPVAFSSGVRRVIPKFKM